MKKSLCGLLGVLGGLGIAATLSYFDYDLADPETFIPWSSVNYDLGNNERLSVHQQKFSLDGSCSRGVYYDAGSLNLYANDSDCDCSFDVIRVGDQSYIRKDVSLYNDSSIEIFNDSNILLRKLLTDRGLCKDE